MIDLYGYWPTPNGHKITLFLEEAALDYTIKPVNISAGDQFNPEFLAFSPNNRMPAIIDHGPVDHGEPVTVFEVRRDPSLPRRKDWSLFPSHRAARSEDHDGVAVLQQMGGLGPMAGSEPSLRRVYAPEKIR